MDFRGIGKQGEKISCHWRHFISGFSTSLFQNSIESISSSHLEQESYTQRIGQGLEVTTCGS